MNAGLCGAWMRGSSSRMTGVALAKSQHVVRGSRLADPREDLLDAISVRVGVAVGHRIHD